MTFSVYWSDRTEDKEKAEGVFLFTWSEVIVNQMQTALSTMKFTSVTITVVNIPPYASTEAAVLESDLNCSQTDNIAAGDSIRQTFRSCLTSINILIAPQKLWIITTLHWKTTLAHNC